MRAAVTLAGLLVAGLAGAEEVPRSYSVMAMVGYGAEALSIGTGSPSRYGVGFGLRAGVSLPKLYVGAALVHHIGYSREAVGAGNNYDARYHSTLFGPELGYDARFGQHVLVRPYLGGGVMFQYARTTVAGVEANDDRFRFHFTPGLLLGLQFGRVTFGADARVTVSQFDVPESWAPAVLGTAGVRF